MTAKELANQLTRIEYPVRIPAHTLTQAKASRLVIVHGGSDDLIEFDGAITDEAGVNGGGVVEIDSQGVIPDFGDVEHKVSECQKWLVRHGNARSIDALWCVEGEGYCWTYKTDIPHETFEVMDGDDHYCRGIVFCLDDISTGKGK